jgi:hypothetical protein
MGVPQRGISFSIRSSTSLRPNSFAALAASGFASFIWPSSAPTICVSETPPISP